MCGLPGRSRTSRSGSSNTSGSRLAAAVAIITASPTRITTPPSSTSAVAYRGRLKPVSSGTYRISSSTALGISSGRSRSRADSSGLTSSWWKKLPIWLVVETKPAISRSQAMERSSSSPISRCSRQARTSVVRRSSPGSRPRSSSTPAM